MNEQHSPFLAVPKSDHVASNETMFAILDGFPVSPGHTLIVPRRPVESVFGLDERERRDALALIEVVCLLLRASHAPDGFNVGFNDGSAAGQTVFHAHIHVIPRFLDDVPDPRGGVRHVIPERGNYLAAPVREST